MLYTYIHHKEYSDVSWDMAHLYEHLVIYSFHSYLVSLGIHPGLIGSVNGDTFEHVVFLNATFYDKKVADAYEHFLTSPELIDTTLVSRVLIECENEDKVLLTKLDEAEFNRQLNNLITSSWINNGQAVSHFVDESSSAKVALKSTQSTKEFSNIVLGFYAETSILNQDEQILLLRLSVIIADILEIAIRREIEGAYNVGRTPISIDKSIMMSGAHLRLRKNVPLEHIKKTAEEALQTLDVQAAMPLIAAQLEEFSNRETWKNFIIEYYRHTGILTNNAYIASLATPDRIASIVQKLEITVRFMQSGDEQWFC